MFELISAVIIGLAVVNLLRMMLYMVGSDLFMIRRARSKNRALSHRPSVSLVVPAHNEGAIIERTLAHLLRVDYEPLQIIVADDGSTDDTLARIRAWKKTYDLDDVITVFTQPNGGKADALNNAIKAMATGELVMCLDGDSTLAPDAVTKSVAYFKDERVVATASNVNIMPNGTILGLVQRFEYMICHQMKKAQNAFNVEYIIGGIGSMFRRSTLDEVGLYDTNTMTEDIDLTMKIIAKGGNKKQRIEFAHDSIAYTNAVLTFPALVRQRYRWKYGRMQTFLKNYRMFFSMERKHTVGLSWFFLPYAIWQEVVYLIEPMVVTIIIGVAIYFHLPLTLVSAIAVISSYVIVNILGTEHLSVRDKLMMSALAPLMYVFLYVLSIVEYVALMQAIVRLPKLPSAVECSLAYSSTGVLKYWLRNWFESQPAACPT
jgi:biofilm PGA synthesis N-glycosyltransferase PgaC